MVGRPRKHPIAARLEPSRPALVEQEPIRPELDELGFRLAVVNRIDASKIEALLIEAAIELPTLSGPVRGKTIEKCVRLLGMLKGAQS